jgi:hypothetical protein
MIKLRRRRKRTNLSGRKWRMTLGMIYAGFTVLPFVQTINIQVYVLLQKKSGRDSDIVPIMQVMPAVRDHPPGTNG